MESNLDGYLRYVMELCLATNGIPIAGSALSHYKERPSLNYC